MNKAELLSYLEKLDNALNKQTMLYVYGSAVGIILDQPDRTSLDIDVAAPYSDVAYADLVQAAEKAGIPVNPPEEFSSNHIEWVQVLRLCLPKPSPDKEMILWQGENLTLKSGSVADLIASKLIRYDEIDQGDIQFLMKQSGVGYSDIEDAVKRLPDTFARDALVNDNLANLHVDMRFWRGEEV
jgi:hypothetical protein